MHNVNVAEIEKTAEAARSDPDVAWLNVTLEGDWHADEARVQFEGVVPFPQGELTLAAEFPPFLGGEGRAPSPLLYCFYGAMCCYGSTFATQAAMAGVELERMSISLRLGVDFRTALGGGEVPPLSPFEFEVVVETEASDEEVAAVKRLTDERCPAIWAMDNIVPYTTVAKKW